MTTGNRWFLCPTPRPGAAKQLFCLPYAGAGPSALRAWPSAFGADVEVHLGHLPGRESRYREPAGVDHREVAAAIAQLADRPYAIFGHSFGGRLSFEVTRALRAGGATLPTRLYPSASRPPHISSNDGILDGLSDASHDELIAGLVAGGGMPTAVLAEPELLELVLPAVRADLGWLDHYRFVEQPPLPVPIVAFAGADDQVVSAAEMHGWAEHTDAGFALRELPGGHFFLHDRLTELTRLIEADLLSVVPATGTGRT